MDIQWSPHNQRYGDLLAVATSIGSITFYLLDLESESVNFNILSWKVVAEPAMLVLSIAWHPYQPHVIGFTLSDGSVRFAESPSGNWSSQDELIQITNVHQHELEAWTLAFVGDELNDLMSGGDDVVLQTSSVNSQNVSFKWKDRKLHQAGVTAILPLTNDLIITGSYDDYIRLITIPAAGRRQVLGELNLGGGVWRMKFLNHQTRQTRIPSMESTKQGSERLPEAQRFVPKLYFFPCMMKHSILRT